MAPTTVLNNAVIINKGCKDSKINKNGPVNNVKIVKTKIILGIIAKNAVINEGAPS
jgi:hypothetical protein